jgi:hypothetical protein
MYCSTCGSRIPEGRSACEACGTAAPRFIVRPGSAVSYAGTAPLAEPISACPRCGFRGQSVGYFSRGTHVAGLVVLTVFTAGFLGVGGLGYYLLRREHRICPRCAQSWGKHGARALSLADAPATRMVPQDAPLADVEGGGGFAWVLFALAAVLFAIGVAEIEPLMLAFSAIAGAGGFMVRQSAGRRREERRAALLQALQLPVLKLAAERRGRLTVTEVASALGWGLPRAEKVLNSLEDGLRVASEVTDEGVIVYEFRELMHAGRGGESAAQLEGSAPERRLDA